MTLSRKYDMPYCLLIRNATSAAFASEIDKENMINARTSCIFTVLSLLKADSTLLAILWDPLAAQFEEQGQLLSKTEKAANFL
jgi:hypothetical protein